MSQMPVVLSEETGSSAKSLGVNLAIIDKRPQANVAKVMNIVGDVEGLNAVLLDDMIGTARTLTEAANALVEKGTKSVTAYATHRYFLAQQSRGFQNPQLTK